MASYMNLVNGNSAYNPANANDIHDAYAEYGAAMILQRKGYWNSAFDGLAFNNYKRAGFDKATFADPFAATAAGAYQLDVLPASVLVRGQLVTLTYSGAPITRGGHGRIRHRGRGR